MKTKHIALTFVASVALMLTACINETEFNEVKLDKNGIAFRISTVQTRSAAENQGLGTFEVATVQTGDGDTFVFEVLSLWMPVWPPVVPLLSPRMSSISTGHSMQLHPILSMEARPSPMQNSNLTEPHGGPIIIPVWANSSRPNISSS